MNVKIQEGSELWFEEAIKLEASGELSQAAHALNQAIEEESHERSSRRSANMVCDWQIKMAA